MAMQPRKIVGLKKTGFGDAFTPNCPGDPGCPGNIDPATNQAILNAISDFVTTPQSGSQFPISQPLSSLQQFWLTYQTPITIAGFAIFAFAFLRGRR